MEESTKPTIRQKKGFNPKSLANLRPGNPPVDIGKHGYSLRSALKEALKDPDLREQFIQSTIQGAMARETVPFKEVWDRVDGKLKDSPQPAQDNRVLNIIVNNEETKKLLSGIGDWSVGDTAEDDQSIPGDTTSEEG